MPRSYDREALEFARAITFFDAIFAFAVTLLITTVDDFTPEAWSSLTALRDANGASLMAFTISFLVVVSFWRGNHRMLASFRALDGRVITVNIAFMFGIVLLPFVTEALGRQGTRPLATAAYALVLAYLGIMQAVLYQTAAGNGLLRHSLTVAQRHRHLLSAVPVPLVFLASIPVAYLSGPNIAQWSWLSLFLAGPLAERVGDRVWGPGSRISWGEDPTHPDDDVTV